MIRCLLIILAGNSRWVHNMTWSGAKEFSATPTEQYLVDGVEAGSLNSYGPLSFLKVSVIDRGVRRLNLIDFEREEKSSSNQISWNFSLIV